MIHLDTNYIIRGATPGTPEAAQVRAWLIAGEILTVSAMAWAEFKCGPLKPGDEADAVSLVGRPEPITAEDADLAAELFNLGGRRKSTLADSLIAAGALRAGASVATANRADFAAFVPAGPNILP